MTFIQKEAHRCSSASMGSVTEAPENQTDRPHPFPCELPEDRQRHAETSVCHPGPATHWPHRTQQTPTQDRQGRHTSLSVLQAGRGDSPSFPPPLPSTCNCTEGTVPIGRSRCQLHAQAPQQPRHDTAHVGVRRSDWTICASRGGIRVKGAGTMRQQVLRAEMPECQNAQVHHEGSVQMRQWTIPPPKEIWGDCDFLLLLLSFSFFLFLSFT